VWNAFSSASRPGSISRRCLSNATNNEGLTYLLTLGVRVLTVTEFVLRRALAQEQARLPDLHPENKQRQTDTPTAERILKAFAKVSLTSYRMLLERTSCGG